MVFDRKTGEVNMEPKNLLKLILMLSAIVSAIVIPNFILPYFNNKWVNSKQTNWIARDGLYDMYLLTMKPSYREDKYLIRIVQASKVLEKTVDTYDPSTDNYTYVIHAKLIKEEEGPKINDTISTRSGDSYTLENEEILHTSFKNLTFIQVHQGLGGFKIQNNLQGYFTSEETIEEAIKRKLEQEYANSPRKLGIVKFNYGPGIQEIKTIKANIREKDHELPLPPPSLDLPSLFFL